MKCTCSICPVPYAPSPMPCTLCLIPCALFPVPYALCSVPYTLYPVPYALHSVSYTLCNVLYTLCPMLHALCSLPYTLCLMLRVLYTVPYASCLIPCAIGSMHRVFRPIPFTLYLVSGDVYRFQTPGSHYQKIICNVFKKVTVLVVIVLNIYTITFADLKAGTSKKYLKSAEVPLRFS